MARYKQNKKNYANKKPSFSTQGVPFNSAQEAWFWFIQAQQARNDGARFTTGLGTPRPCEPIDFLKIMDDLYRKRRLTMDHFKVLRHYGIRGMPPELNRPKESRAWHLWREALSRMEPILERKGITARSKSAAENWVQEALIYESGQDFILSGIKE